MQPLRRCVSRRAHVCSRSVKGSDKINSSLYFYSLIHPLKCHSHTGEDPVAFVKEMSFMYTMLTSFDTDFIRSRKTQSICFPGKHQELFKCFYSSQELNKEDFPRTNKQFSRPTQYIFYISNQQQQQKIERSPVLVLKLLGKVITSVS